MTPVPSFSQIGRKISEARILTWNNTENCLMMSYLIMMTSAKLLSILRDFVPEYHHAKFGGSWPQIKEKQRGAPLCPLPQPIFYQNTPAWIGLNRHIARIHYKQSLHTSKACFSQFILKPGNFGPFLSGDESGVLFRSDTSRITSSLYYFLYHLQQICSEMSDTENNMTVYHWNLKSVKK